LYFPSLWHFEGDNKSLLTNKMYENNGLHWGQPRHRDRRQRIDIHTIGRHGASRRKLPQ